MGVSESAYSTQSVYDPASATFVPKRNPIKKPLISVELPHFMPRAVDLAVPAPIHALNQRTLPRHIGALLKSLMRIDEDTPIPELLTTPTPQIPIGTFLVRPRILLTCIKVGGPCAPTCPPEFHTSIDSLVSYVSVKCPSGGEEANSEAAGLLAAWMAVADFVPKAWRMVLLDPAIVSFEPGLLHTANSTQSFITSGSLSYGVPSSHISPNPSNAPLRTGWLQNAGISFRMSGIPQSPALALLHPPESFESEWIPRKIYTPVPVNFKQGFEVGSPAVRRTGGDEILGVSGHVAVVDVDAVRWVGGFCEGFTDPHLAVVELCLRWRVETGKARCGFEGGSVAVAEYFDYDALYLASDSIKRVVEEFPRGDVDLLWERHTGVIMDWVLEGLWVNERITLRYDTIWGRGGCGGWFTEILPYLTTLERRLFSVSIPSEFPDKWCSGLYPAYRDILNRMRLNPILHKPSTEYPFVYINHVQGKFVHELKSLYSPLFHLSHKVHHSWHHPIRPTLLIARSMTETNTVLENPFFPKGWWNRYAKVDQVWVPAPFLKDVFVESGVLEGMVKVLGEVVDLGRFDVRRGKVWRVPRDLVYLRGGAWDWWREKRCKWIDLEMHRDDAQPDEVVEPGPCRFIFLSVFKWEPRKDPETLVHAFLQTFGVDSGVCLVISTKASGRNVTEGQARDPEIIYESIAQIASEMPWLESWDPATLSTSPPEPDHPFLQKLHATKRPTTLKQIKRIIKVTTESREWDDLPSLYAIADAYVSASHGEGWGLPVHEALAMQLPVIASATTGHLAFLKHENAWLVPLETDALTHKPRKVKVPEEAVDDFGPSACWDQVDWKRLSKAMWDVAVQTLHAQDDKFKETDVYLKPKRARQELMSHGSPEVVMKKWATAVAEAVAELI
ncbi:hypothetical protein HDU98_009097 [Podochytrium sp. JEL0797]|nr:hypothetical protein HDU98_009097 [Podochytrium sp. JEL0797]